MAKPQQSTIKKSVQTSSGRIAYTEQGSGPVALFVHGVLLTGHLWRHQLAELSDIRRCIAVDLLAHGDTEIAPDQDGVRDAEDCRDGANRDGEDQHDSRRQPTAAADVSDGGFEICGKRHDDIVRWCLRDGYGPVARRERRDRVSASYWADSLKASTVMVASLRTSAQSLLVRTASSVQMSASNSAPSRDIVDSFFSRAVRDSSWEGDRRSS